MEKTTKTRDELVKELYDNVQARKSEITAAERPVWETEGTFGFTANSAHDRVNIKTITHPGKLVEILSFLYERQSSIEKASLALGIKHNFKWLGYTVEEWEKDLKTRTNQITIQEKRKNLTELENRLIAFAPELKERIELESLIKEVGSL